MLVRGVDADAGFAAHYAQHSLVVHGVEQMRGGVRGASPIIGDAAVGKVVIDFAGMDVAAFAHELEQQLRPLAPRRGPAHTALCGIATIGTGMHERLQLAGYEAVIDEEIFFDTELRVAAFQIAGTIIFDAMPQDQVLRAGWGADGIGLHEAEFFERTFERDRREQAARDGKSAQVVEGDRHRVGSSLRERLRDVLVDGEPLAVLILPDYGPAEVAHLDFAGFGGHFIGDRGGAPGPITLSVNCGIVIHSELGAFVVADDGLHARLVLVPTVVLERGDIEEGAGAGGIEHGHIGGIERGPAGPDGLHVGFVWRAWRSLGGSWGGVG